MEHSYCYRREEGGKKIKREGEGKEGREEDGWKKLREGERRGGGTRVWRKRGERGRREEGRRGEKVGRSVHTGPSQSATIVVYVSGGGNTTLIKPVIPFWPHRSQRFCLLQSTSCRKETKLNHFHYMKINRAFSSVHITRYLKIFLWREREGIKISCSCSGLISCHLCILIGILKFS